MHPIVACQRLRGLAILLLTCTNYLYSARARARALAQNAAISFASLQQLITECSWIETDGSKQRDDGAVGQHSPARL